ATDAGVESRGMPNAAATAPPPPTSGSRDATPQGPAACPRTRPPPSSPPARPRPAPPPPAPPPPPARARNRPRPATHARRATRTTRPPSPPVPPPARVELPTQAPQRHPRPAQPLAGEPEQLRPRLAARRQGALGQRGHQARVHVVHAVRHREAGRPPVATEVAQ